MSDAIGISASLGTAGCWAMTALFFSAAGRRIGSKSVNRIRLVIAIVFLIATMFVLGLPWEIPTNQLVLFGLSGVIGLALGDAIFFESLVILGPRRAALIMSCLSPVFAAMLMVPLLSETIGVIAIAGMALTIGGVGWVISERAAPGATQGNIRLGVLLAMGGALCQAGGLIVAKAALGRAADGSLLASWSGLSAREGMSGVDIHATYGTLIRMITALFALLLYSAIYGGLRKTLQSTRDRKGMVLTATGAFFGPFLGVTLSLIAVANANTAVASTVMAMSPILVIPIVIVVYKEKVSWRAWAGAIVAVAGVALLSLRELLKDSIGQL